MSSSTWPWLSLALLGAFHGLNPAMGWLFAVAIGFQERRLRAVVAALGPITLGHALAIALVAIPVGLLGLYVPSDALMVATGVALLGFAAHKIASKFRHPRWVGMRVRRRELVFWSFIMATAHGAGLMLAPVLIETSADAPASASAYEEHAHHLAAAHPAEHLHHLPESDSGVMPAVWAVIVHSGMMLVVATLLAVTVFRFVGVERLGRLWINLDLLWVGVFVVVGVLTLGAGLWGLAPV